MDRRDIFFRQYQLSREPEDMIRYLTECSRVGSLSVNLDIVINWLLNIENLDELMYPTNKCEVLSFLLDDFLEFALTEPDNETPRHRHRRHDFLKDALPAIIAASPISPDLFAMASHIFSASNELEFDFDNPVYIFVARLFYHPPNKTWLHVLYGYCQSGEIDSRAAQGILLGSLQFCDTTEFKRTFYNTARAYLRFDPIPIGDTGHVYSNILRFNGCDIFKEDFKYFLENYPRFLVNYSYIGKAEMSILVFHALHSLRMMGEHEYVIKNAKKFIKRLEPMPIFDRREFEKLITDDWEVAECPWALAEYEAEAAEFLYPEDYD